MTRWLNDERKMAGNDAANTGIEMVYRYGLDTLAGVHRASAQERASSVRIEGDTIIFIARRPQPRAQRRRGARRWRIVVTKPVPGET